jgi:amino acid transporter
VLTAYLFWKFFRNTKVISLDTISLEDVFNQAEQHYLDETRTKQKKHRWLRIISWIWD